VRLSSCHRPAPTATYTLSLHDALPICPERVRPAGPAGPSRRAAAARQRTRVPARREALGTPGGKTGRPAAGRSPRATGHLEPARSEEHTSELQSQSNLVCRLLLEKKKK